MAGDPKLYIDGKEVVYSDSVDTDTLTVDDLVITKSVNAGTFLDTSGEIISVTANPTTNSTATIVDISADGTNWGAGSNALNISCRDNSTNAIRVDNGLGAQVFAIDRLGNFSIAGSIIYTTSGTITSLSNSDVTIDPNGTGKLILNSPVVNEVQSGITASAVQSQGQQPLTKTVSEVATVGTTGDVVTLPTAYTGLTIYVINNGANSMDVYPASGDDIDKTGVNTAVAQAAGSRATYIAIDATNWAKF